MFSSLDIILYTMKQNISRNVLNGFQFCKGDILVEKFVYFLQKIFVSFNLLIIFFQCQIYNSTKLQMSSLNLSNLYLKKTTKFI